MAKADVIDIRTWRKARGRQRHNAPTIAKPASVSTSYLIEFVPPKPAKTSSQNRYDAAFKGYMAKRARELCWELEFSLSDRAYRDTATRDAQIRWVIAQIRAIEAEVLRTVPEHHRPTTGSA